jgi:tetratricopeptide (TPR) repeat protein
MAINKNKVMEAAQKFAEKGQTDKAIKEYLKIVQEDPKDVRVWLKIGDLYAKKGSKQEATETYLKVAQFYGDQGFYLKAVAVYKQILKLEPRLVDVNLKLAEVYRQLGLLSDAMQQYELVAAFYHREGKTREALATIRELVELDPDNVATRIKLAELYSKEQMVKEAVVEFGRAAEFLRSHNRMDDFVKVAERLVWHQPDNHAMNRELAGLYLKRNDPRHALQKLQVLFKANPRDVDTLGLLAQAFLGLDQRQKSVSVWKELARIHTEDGRPAQAHEAYRRILAVDPTDNEAVAAVGTAPPPQQAVVARRVGAGTHAEAPRTAPPSPPVQQPFSGAPFPRVATPIGGVPLGGTSDVPRIAEPLPTTRQSGEVPVVAARRTAAIPLVSEDFLRNAGMLDDDDPQAYRMARQQVAPPAPAPHVPAPQPAAPVHVPREPSRPADLDVELDMDEVPGGEDAVLHGGGDLPDLGEAHADEIAKILTETDVYIKYSLHQKAIDHLRRVFELDPRNLEAREKLKDIYVALNREADACAELYRLAEMTVSSNPSQAAAYLRELLSLDPTDQRARALAHRAHLDVPEADEAVGTVDAAQMMGELSLDGEPLDGEVESEIAVEASISVPVEGPSGDYGMDLEFEDVGGAGMSAPPVEAAEHEHGDGDGTQDVDPDQIAAEVALDADEIGAEIAFETPAPRRAYSYSGFDAGMNPRTLEDRVRTSGPTEQTFDADLDDFGVEGAVAHEHEEFSLDPGDDALAESMGAEPEPAPPVAEPPPVREVTGVGGGSLEDDLDEADFFVSQSLFAEARSILGDLLVRYPNHPLVVAKMQDLDAIEGVGGGAHDTGAHDTAAHDTSAHDMRVHDTGDMELADLPDMPEMPAGSPLPSTPMPTPPPPRRPTVIAKGLSADDADTHYDLGLAYKEMGLFDEAIKEFTLVRDTPGRAVICHKMIGLCHVGRGKLNDAINEFKNGLYIEGITEAQALDLYVEIGGAYEGLGDPREAVYYYEKVSKRDPRFREVDRRLAALTKLIASQSQGGGGRRNGSGSGSGSGSGQRREDDDPRDHFDGGTGEITGP